MPSVSTGCTAHDRWLAVGDSCVAVCIAVNEYVRRIYKHIQPSGTFGIPPNFLTFHKLFSSLTKVSSTFRDNST